MYLLRLFFASFPSFFFFPKKVFLEFENQFLFSFFFTFLSPSTFTVQKLIFQKRFSNVFPASNIKPKRELFFAFQYHELDWHPQKNFKTKKNKKVFFTFWDLPFSFEWALFSKQAWQPFFCLHLLWLCEQWLLFCLFQPLF